MSSTRVIEVYKIHGLAKILTFDLQLGTQLLVYRDKVVLETGLIRIAQRHIPIGKITDITVRQGIFGRVFGFGNLYIETAGSPDAEVVVMGLEKITEASDIIIRLIR